MDHPIYTWEQLRAAFYPWYFYRYWLLMQGSPLFAADD